MRRSAKAHAAKASLNEFAEKVSKATLSLGVAGAVLAQVRRSVDDSSSDTLIRLPVARVGARRRARRRRTRWSERTT